MTSNRVTALGFASTTVAVGAKLATGNFGGAVQSVGSYVFGSAISKALALGLEPNASEVLKFETDAVGDITADNFPHSCGAGSRHANFIQNICNFIYFYSY